ncbi:hypothetical protein LTR85_003908 [Meristemomyces frigidus]|nr:hypothetical protein LTR85_003908 [Meristemomyces frigidus]
MSFVKTIIFGLAAASMAFALPNSEQSSSGSSSGSTTACGNDQTLACCTSGGSDNLLGLNCLSVPVVGVPVQQACGSNVAACCSNNDSGAIVLDASCNAIPL